VLFEHRSQLSEAAERPRLDPAAMGDNIDMEDCNLHKEIQVVEVRLPCRPLARMQAMPGASEPAA
jgi:hypothetical protein